MGKKCDGLTFRSGHDWVYFIYTFVARCKLKTNYLRYDVVCFTIARRKRTHWIITMNCVYASAAPATGVTSPLLKNRRDGPMIIYPHHCTLITVLFGGVLQLNISLWISIGPNILCFSLPGIIINHRYQYIIYLNTLCVITRFGDNVEYSKL